MSFRYLIIYLVMGFASVNYTFAQDIPEQTENLAEQEIRARGLDEEEVKNRLEARGFDLDNITPEQLPELETALEEIVAEMEKEKANQDSVVEETGQTTQEAIEQKSEEIQNKVTEGASVKEALSETTSEVIEEEKVNLTNIYGHSVFTGSELSLYRSADDIPAPSNYILGAGDQLRVSIFGRSQADFNYTILQDGSINPEQMPKIFLKGLSIEQARKLLIKRFSLRYTFLEEQFSVVLNTARTITVNIFGQVAQPGSYTISALNTAFNAMVACKGPTANGSVRNIKLMKDNNEVKELDVYEFLTNPTVRFDFALDNNDMIYVPFSQKVVTIRGAVKRPMMYELKEGENLKELVKFAGGLSSNARTELIRINRQGANERELLEVNLDEILSGNSNFKIQNGDIITISTIPDEFKSFVSVSGAVVFPGNYSTKENQSLSQVLRKARFREEARTDLAYIIRTNNDGSVELLKTNPQAILEGSETDISLQPRDRITIYNKRKFVNQNRNLVIAGAVRQKVKELFKPEAEVKLSDMVEMAGGLQPNATGKGILTRKNLSNNNKREFITVNLEQAVNNPESNYNISLSPGDSIFAYNVEYFEEQYTVELAGLVRNPQTFIYDSSLNFRDMVMDAGGLTPQANRYGMLIRKDTINRKKREYRMIDVQALMNGKETIEIKPGDEFRIYNQETFINQFEISILGAVNTPNTFVYDSTLSVKDALLMGGGLQLDADPKRVDVYRIEFADNGTPRTIIRSIELDPQGSMIDATDQNFQLEPFDIIIVRTIPDYRLQEVVQINGRVKYPGPYVLMEKPEKLTDIVERAGGLSPDAFPSGATLVRSQGDINGIVVISLDKALKKENHKTNMVLREGDIISIPRLESLVSIRTTGTRAREFLQDTLIENNAINVNFDGRKSAGWYVKNYAGGFAEDANRKSVKVVYPNGRIKGTKSFLFFRNYPQVLEGSKVLISMQPPEVQQEEEPAPEPKKEVDWNEVIRTVSATTALLTSTLTAILLLDRINDK
ncbi:SLBB domain-containing protein [Membranihabitans maritimus]|uniref:SLBB domain-containing protein n=1 Tax=Membranihabitans maritimus TaxID=2904244 RepID=UPI001F1691CA|nr:SLBB domain-containing protein [Membranihabitans maritimus]